MSALEAFEMEERPTIVYLKRGDKITPRAVEWAWRHYLARGKLHLLAGPAGIGKTTCALSLAAALTAAGLLPDGSIAPCGSVVIWSGEDDLEDTLIPRLIAHGADMKKVHFVSDVSEDGRITAFDPSKHLDDLRRVVGMLSDVVLILIDPVMSAVRGDSNKSGDVRRGLAPLQALAEYTKTAVLGITHFSKGTQGKDPLERVTGSQAFGAVARIVFAAARRTEEGDQVFMRAKSNIGPVGGGFTYRIEVVPVPGHPLIEASIVKWTGSIDGDARDVLHSAESFDEEGSSLGSAKTFLADLLSDGPMHAQRVFSESQGAGHSQATIRRAKESLGVRVEKEPGVRGKWRWAIPLNP